MSPIDEKAKNEFCRLLAAKSWIYDQPPSYFYRLWESYISDKNIEYPWSNRRYELQKEAEMAMCELIHRIYKKVSGAKPVQLVIQWE